MNSGFFHFIDNTYGVDTTRNLKTWLNLDYKLASSRNRRVFLLQCRTKGIIPNHIKNNIKCLFTTLTDENPFQNETDRILNRFRKSVLNLEIKITIWKIKDLESKLAHVKSKISDILPLNILNNFKSRALARYNNCFSNIKNRNIQKIKNISLETSNFKLSTHEKFIFNYSKVQLPIEVKRILCAGPKLSVPVNLKQIPIPTIIKDLEYCISNVTINEGEKNELRAKTTNALTNYYNRMKNSNQHSEITMDFIKTKQFLHENQNLIISRSDKGNSTVIMDRDEYLAGMNLLLQDNETYKKLKSDPTNKFQGISNDLVNEMKEGNFISESQCRDLKTYNAVAPKLYGLRKTHKQNFSLRPIVSCINSPSYKLASFIHEILTQVTTTFHYNVMNSYEFVENTKTITLEEGYILISLDVVSLFTNIPKELVLKIVKNSWRFLSAYTNLNFKMFSLLIEFLFNTSYFTFDNVFYQQLDGTAMGNPASPVLSNLVMNDLINFCLNKLPFKVDFLKVYVDDTILAVPKTEVSEVMKVFNSYHHKLKFTCELEQNNSLAFLDTLVIRELSGKLKTNWYSKPSSSGRLLNYYSNHHIKHKIGTVKNLLHRSYHLSSTEYHKENINKIKLLLKMNNYPAAFTNRILNEYKPLKSQCETTAKSNNRYFKFPYIKGLSEKVSGCFKNKNINSDRKVQLSFYPINLVSTIFTNLKDKTPRELKSNLIYKINCRNCEKCYVGTTKQYLKNRIYQHSYDCRERNRNKPEKTALAEHHFAENHEFDFENFSVLDSENNYFKRMISEMVHIQLNKTVNCRTDVTNLSAFYNNILKTYKQNHIQPNRKQ